VTATRLMYLFFIGVLILWVVYKAVLDPLCLL
ncbi:hypothetical protein A2U01_0115632, partial [Trifolium medium]|nr:hypothetical protein [Trifolium medium]